MLTDGLEWCGLLVDYCDVFISCLDSHSDGTHSLQRIHCWASDGKLNFSKSDEETLIYISDGLRVSKISSNVYFWVNFSFKNVFVCFLCRDAKSCCQILEQHAIHRIIREQRVSVSRVWKTKHWNVPTRFLTLSGRSWSFIFWNAYAFDAIWKKSRIITNCEAERRWWSDFCDETKKKKKQPQA